MNKSFFKTVLFFLTVILFASCDKDFNEIGSDIIGEEHFFGTYTSEVNVVAYNNRFGAVQSNNLPINALGIYTNPFFGTTKASVVTQVELKSQDPTIKPNPEVTKVEMSIPYFSTPDELDSDGNRTYILDSIYGNGKIKLSVHESNYFLRDLDPATGFQEPQAYYSDFDMTGSYDELVLNDSTQAPGQNEDFFFDKSEIVTYKLDDDGNSVVDERTKPAMTLRLNKAFFEEKLFSAAAAPNLVTNNAFKQYFRGLYFKVDHSSNFPTQEALAQIDFGGGTITVNYTAETQRKDTDGNLVLVDGLPERGPYSMVLSLTGNTVNILETTDSAEYTAGTATPNLTVGDANLYLKGGPGSSAIIELFGPDTDANGTADQLEFIRTQNWKVNNAALTFYINRSDMTANVPDPNRVYLYDLENKLPLVDYTIDGSSSRSAKYNRYIHDGLVDTTHVDAAGNLMYKYRIRLTNHIRKLLDSDDPADNVKLGLVVTESIGLLGIGKKKDHQPVPIATDWVPMASVINPLGTVLYGTDPSVPEPQRLKLEIYYTTYPN